MKIFLARTTALALAVLVTPGAVLAPVSPAAAAPAALPAAAAAPAITGAANFRDVAGTGLPLANGGTMAVGLVYRSSRLVGLTQADIDALAATGITDIYDLRGPTAAAKAPDPVVPGATYHRIDIFAGTADSSSRITATAAAREHMRDMNRHFVTVSAQRARIAKVLRAIASAPGPVVVHCTAGKDRTGWVSALLQRIAGVAPAGVYEEYLRSNTYRAADIEASVAAALASGGESRAAAVRELETVRTSYLRAGFLKVKARYGSVNRYLKRGLGLSVATIEALRARLRTA